MILGDNKWLASEGTVRGDVYCGVLFFFLPLLLLQLCSESNTLPVTTTGLTCPGQL